MKKETDLSFAELARVTWEMVNECPALYDLLAGERPSDDFPLLQLEWDRAREKGN